MRKMQSKARGHDAAQPVQYVDKAKNECRIELISCYTGNVSVVIDDGAGDGGPNCHRQQLERSARAEAPDGGPAFCVREQLERWKGDNGRLQIPPAFPVLDDKQRERMAKMKAWREGKIGAMPSLDVGVPGVDRSKSPAPRKAEVKNG